MPLAIEQYPEFLKENRWPLPISVFLVIVLWVVPFFRHDRAHRIWNWASSKGWFGISLSVLVAVLLLAAGVTLSVKLFRFHSNHLASVLRKKELRPELSEQKREESKKESPKTENPPATKKKFPAKSIGETDPPAFAVAIETSIFVPGPSKDIAGTGFWAWNFLGNSGCTLSSVDAALFIRIKNLQQKRVMITAYNVHTIGGELIRLKMNISKPFLILGHGSLKASTQQSASIQIPVPAGNLGVMVQFPLKDADPSVAAPIQADFLDNLVGEHYINPGDTVRGWAFFQYPNPATVPAGGFLQISDDIGHTFRYEIPNENGNPMGDTLRRTLAHGPTVDLSSCVMHPDPALPKTKTTAPQTSSPTQNCPNGVCIGGDNNGTATVNNFGPPPLKISPEQQTQITAFLKANGITSGKVVIFVDGPTIETQAASNNLVKALKDAGVDATSVEGVLVPPMGTPVYPGISFDITPETYTLANEIGRALMASHVVNSPVRANQSSGLNALYITVRKP